MKRTVLAAVLVVVLVLGVVAYAAAANTGTVAVTAKVNPNIAMTIDVTSHDWSTSAQTLDVADVSGSSNIEVRSNAVWDFTVTPTVDAGLSGVILDTYDAYAPSTAAGLDIPRGITNVAATYTLDLTSNPAAYLLDPATTYNASYLYTAAPAVP